MKTINVLEKLMEMRKFRKIIFFNKYKILKISAETYAKNCLYNIIDKEKMLRARKKDIGEKLGVENIYYLIDKELKGRFETRNPTKKPREYKRHESQLIDGEKCMYTSEDIIMPIIL